MATVEDGADDTMDAVLDTARMLTMAGTIMWLLLLMAKCDYCSR